MQTALIVALTIVLGLLGNLLANRYEVKCPNGLLWFLLFIGGLFLALHEQIAEQLENWLSSLESEKTAQILIGIALAALILVCFAFLKRSEPSATKATSSLDYKRIQLIDAVSALVALRRKETLHKEQMMQVPFDEQPKAVGRQRRSRFNTIDSNADQPKIEMRAVVYSLGNSQQFTEAKPLNEPIINVFWREDVQGRLLILGAPGSGKTTYLLQLARDLVEAAKRETERAVPAIVEISSWQEEPIETWLIKQLRETYNVAENISEVWLQDNQLILLLDGLDELGMDKQKAFSQQFNDFLKNASYRPKVVMCCRREEFEQGNIQLDQLQGAVCLQALEDEQIQDYLLQLKQIELWQAIRVDDALRKLAQSPFLLTILADAYTGKAIPDKNALFSQYVEQRFTKPTTRQWYTAKQEPRPAKTLHYLAWLARQVNRKERTFYIEKMQPSMLSDSQRWKYRLIVGLIGGLIVGLILGLILGLIGGLIGGLGEIELVESFKFSMSREARREILKELKLGLIFGLIGGLIGGLILGLKTDIEIRQRPNQGIINSRNNFFWLLPIMFVASVLMIGLPRLAVGQEIIIADMLIFSIGNAIWLSLCLAGGMAYIQHYLLRASLCYSSTQAVPWQYAQFLSYAADRRLLQQIGGGYRFIHEELREYFANMPLNPEGKQNSVDAIAQIR